MPDDQHHRRTNMSSVIFQPLLHDPLGWKSSNTTYADTFKWRKHRSTSKDKRISTYGQQYQRELRKQQLEQKSLQQTNTYLPSATSEEQINQQVVPTKRNEENRGLTSMSFRCKSSKTHTMTAEEFPISILETKQRPASTNREATYGSRGSQHPPTAHDAAAAEGTIRPTTVLETRRASAGEKEKVIIDADNDNSRHWLTFPNPKTPQYLIDIKQRLGQLKVPSTLARPTSAAPASLDRSQQPCHTIQRSESSVSSRPKNPPNEKRHMFDFNLPQTPDELRAARHRLDKHRYNPALDSYPTRPYTCPVHTNDVVKPITPLITSESKDELISTDVQTTSIKDDAWTANEDETKIEVQEASSFLIQPTEVEGLPSEYTEAVETANAAQEEYLKNEKLNAENDPENCAYRLPSRSADNKSESLNAYRAQQKSATQSTVNLIRDNDFTKWVRNATDKERESALKILQDVLYQPIIGYDFPVKKPAIFKHAAPPPPPSTIRSKSATRKLGRTRHHHRIQCEICEKQLINNHIWDITRSDGFTCPHRAQAVKAPLIQVRVS